MTEEKNKKKIIRRSVATGLFVFVFIGSFLFGEKTSAALLGDYNKAVNGTLSAIEWNNLLIDFLSNQGGRIDGPIGIGTATSSSYMLDVNGVIRATSISGSYTGTLNAANISSGNFAANTGGGNFSFPGNVGIGTTSPGHQLHLVSGTDNDQFTIQNTSATGYANFWVQGTGRTWQIGTAGASEATYGVANKFFVYDRNTGGAAGMRMVIDTSGNVGIGTTNPTQKLTLGAANNRLYFSDAGSGTKIVMNNSGSSYMSMGAFNSGTVSRIGFGKNADYNSNTITEILSILDSGNVGIGTNNPGAKLVVNNSTVYGVPTSDGADLAVFSTSAWATSGGLSISRLSNTDGTPASLSFNRGYSTNMALPANQGLGIINFRGSNGSGWTRSAYIYSNNSTDIAASTGYGDLRFGTNSGAADASERMRIAEGGNIGIGTTTPTTARLVISPSGSYSIDALGGRIGNISSVLDTDAASVSYVKSVIAGTSTVPTVGYWTVNGLNIYNANSGNVGIGMNNPLVKLEIAGSTSADGVAVLKLERSDVPNRNIQFIPSDGGDVSTIQFSGNSAPIVNFKGGSNYALNSGILNFGTGQAFHAIQYVNGSGLQITENEGITFNMGNPANNKIQFTSTGNVGIGTTSPQFKLDVAGTGSFTQPVIVGTPTAAGHAATKNYVDSTIGGGSGSTVGYWTMNGTNIYNSNSGNVGIGTTNPNKKLTINAIGTSTTITNISQLDGYAVYPTLPGNDLQTGALLYSSSGGAAITMGRTGWATNISLFTNPSSTTVAGSITERMRIYGSGTVQIGSQSSEGWGTLTVNDGSANKTLLQLGEVYGALNIFQAAKNTDYYIVAGASAGSPWYARTANTSMMRFYNGSLRFYTDAGSAGDFTPTERMTILSTGSIGIGTTSPQFKLDVAGTGSFTQPVIVGTPTAAGHAATKNYVDSVIGGGSGSTVGYWTMSGSDIYNSNSGSVGIGTTNPLAKLNVTYNADNAGPNGGQMVVLQNISAGNSAQSRLGFNRGADLGTGYNRGMVLFAYRTGAGWADYEGRPLQFFTGASAGAATLRMSIVGGGGVGIGTADPGAYLLNVNGDTNITGNLNVTGTITGGSAFAGTINAANVSSGAFAANTGGGNFSFPGNVGIGSASPAAKLDVNGDIRTSYGNIYAYGQWDNGYLAMGYPGGGNARLSSNMTNIDIYPNNSLSATFNSSGLHMGPGRIIYGESNQAYLSLIVPGATYTKLWNISSYMTFGTNNLERLRIDTSGNVGIGTTDPSAAKLVINSGAGTTALKAIGNAIITGTLQTETGSDFAEEFVTRGYLEPGTVVVMDDNGHKSVRPCDKSYDKTVVGIVSNNPSIVAGRVTSEHKAIIAMMGVVKVKVSDVNGSISKGDLLTTSGIYGYAMKSENTKPGTVIGKAMEDLQGHTGEVNVLVNLQ